MDQLVHQHEQEEGCYHHRQRQVAIRAAEAYGKGPSTVTDVDDGEENQADRGDQGAEDEPEQSYPETQGPLLCSVVACQPTTPCCACSQTVRPTELYDY